MTQWRIKELSDVTKISVRMLHHYDKIGLLKPSGRSTNGYRWYSEDDLATLQHIIALKSFGFDLSTIKTMLQQKQSLHEHLLLQQKMLMQQSDNLRSAHDALSDVLDQYRSSKSFDHNNLIKLIERYHMSEELKNTWVSKLSEKEQDRFIDLKKRYPKEIGAWFDLFTAINSGKLGDPKGPDGTRAVEAFLEFQKFSAMLDAQKANKKITEAEAQEIVEYAKRNVAGEGALNKEGSIWFGQAMIEYQLQLWTKLHKDISNNLNIDPESAVGKKIAEQWREILAMNCMGSTIDMMFGIQILHKMHPQKATELCLDPMAIQWIDKALKTKF